jgi:hypothetical protein
LFCAFPIALIIPQAFPSSLGGRRRRWLFMTILWHLLWPLLHLGRLTLQRLLP